MSKKIEMILSEMKAEEALVASKVRTLEAILQRQLEASLTAESCAWEEEVFGEDTPAADVLWDIAKAEFAWWRRIEVRVGVAIAKLTNQY